MKGRYEIECETRRGFHASLGRGDPCTQYKRGCGTEFTLSEVEGSLLELVGGRRAILLTSPEWDVASHATCYSPLPLSCGRGRALGAGEGELLRERRPDASRPVGEGSGLQATRAAGRHLSFLLSHSSHDFSLCHPERSLRSEGSRASARACMAGTGHRSVRRDSSPQRLRMAQKNVSAGFCDVIAEPSPTGRDAAGPLSRKITGEVLGARGRCARNRKRTRN
jgi:hypothetical protein